MAATASACEQHATHAAAALMVGEMEGGEADVGEFFLAERAELARHEIRPLLKLAGRQCRRSGTSRQ
jgi:hypothetical protein